MTNAAVRSGPRLRREPQALSALPDDLWHGLMTIATSVTLERKQVLFHAGDEGSGCYVVRSGALKAVMATSDGSERMIAVFDAGKIVGELALFDNQPRSATVIAVRPSRLAHVSKVAFFGFADAHPDVYRHVLAVLAQRLRTTTADVVMQRTATVAARVAKAMLKLDDGLGEATGPGKRLFAQRVTQSDIAAMAGVARENASRAISEWLRAGIVSRSGGFYCIENRGALIDIARRFE